jgi:hypothetical protein
LGDEAYGQTAVEAGPVVGSGHEWGFGCGPALGAAVDATGEVGVYPTVVEVDGGKAPVVKVKLQRIRVIQNSDIHVRALVDVEPVGQLKVADKDPLLLKRTGGDKTKDGLSGIGEAMEVTAGL